MPTIEIHNDRIYVWSELHDRERIKLVPGANWDKDTQQWHLPLSWASCVAMRGVFGSELTIGAHLREWAVQHRANVIDPAMALRPSMEVPELMAEEPALFPFQRVGVKFLTTVGQGLLADDMGSGKTVQLIRTVARLGVNKILVVCPNSMKYVWKDEWDRWEPGRPVSVIDGTAAQRRKAIAAEADVFVINWESLRLHSRLAPYGSIALTNSEKEPKDLNGIDWDVVIADEGHRAKDPKSKQTRALWAVSENARYRFAATGTPIESHPGELWSLMHFVSPDNFPRKTKYVDRYCHQVFNPFGGMDIDGLRADTAAEFHQIVDPLVLRRPKDLILPQLPPKTETVRYIPFSGKQEKAYKQMRDDLIAELKGGDVVYALDPLAQFIRLSQFASAYAEIGEHGSLQLSMPSNKIDTLMDILGEAGSEQVVVFAESKQLIILAGLALEKEGIRFGYITGDTTPDQRAVAVRDFQENRLRVMLCTSAGAEGITLTSARILVFLQRFWSSIKNAQAADRIHRIGQERGVEIITLATLGTVDEMRERSLREKGMALQEILKDDDLRLQMFEWGKSTRRT